MKKAEFIAKLAEASDYNKTVCEAFWGLCMDIIGEELVSGGEMTLPNIGKLKVKAIKARKGRNPKTGEEIQIPAKNKVVFSAAKELKEKL